MLLKWTGPLGAIANSPLGSYPNTLDTTSPTGWFDDVG
jgi:hypothetical protein